MYTYRAFWVALVVKNPSANAGDNRNPGWIPGSGRLPGEWNGNPLQYSCLENSMDRGAWQATVHGIAYTFHFQLNTVRRPEEGVFSPVLIAEPNKKKDYFPGLNSVNENHALCSQPPKLPFLCCKSVLPLP